MKVILIDDVHHVGRRGDVIRAKPGFARNYLIPQRLAVNATPANQKWFEQQRKKIEERSQKTIAHAQEIAARMSGVTLVIEKRAGENETLYGSVTASDIAEGLLREGFEVDRRRIDLEGGIKTLGEHEVRIAIHPEVEATVQVVVNPEA